MPQQTFVKTIADIGGGTNWRPSIRQQTWKQMPRSRLNTHQIDMHITHRKKVNSKIQVHESPSRKKLIEHQTKPKLISKRRQLCPKLTWSSNQVEGCLLSPEKYFEEPKLVKTKPLKMLSDRSLREKDSTCVRAVIGPFKKDEDIVSQTEIQNQNVLKHSASSARQAKDCFFSGEDARSTINQDSVSNEKECEIKPPNDENDENSESDGISETDDKKVCDMFGTYNESEYPQIFGTSVRYIPWKSKAYTIHGTTVEQERIQKIKNRQNVINKYVNHHWKSNVFNENNTNYFELKASELPVLRPTVRCRISEPVRNPITGEEFEHVRIHC